MISFTITADTFEEARDQVAGLLGLSLSADDAPAKAKSEPKATRGKSKKESAEKESDEKSAKADEPKAEPEPEKAEAKNEPKPEEKSDEPTLEDVQTKMSELIDTLGGADGPKTVFAMIEPAKNASELVKAGRAAEFIAAANEKLAEAGKK